jgi:hypothetical protein
MLRSLVRNLIEPTPFMLSEIRALEGELRFVAASSPCDRFAARPEH